MFFANWAKRQFGAYYVLATHIHFLLENVRGTTHGRRYSLFFRPPQSGFSLV